MTTGMAAVLGALLGAVVGLLLLIRADVHAILLRLGRRWPDRRGAGPDECRPLVFLAC